MIPKPILVERPFMLLRKMMRHRQINEETKCWNWSGRKHPFGHGLINWCGRGLYVHRIMAILTGILPNDSDLLVLHKCDNPSCFNPAHLEAGTHRKNQNDSWLRGRQYPQSEEKNGRAQIGELDVHLIRRAYDLGQTQESIANVFGITKGAIRNIVKGRTWRFVGAIC